MKTAYFSLGCFWSPQLEFEKIKGNYGDMTLSLPMENCFKRVILRTLKVYSEPN